MSTRYDNHTFNTTAQAQIHVGFYMHPEKAALRIKD